MICSKCNKEIDSNSKFCPYCGNQISNSREIANDNKVESTIDDVFNQSLINPQNDNQSGQTNQVIDDNINLNQNVNYENGQEELEQAKGEAVVLPEQNNVSEREVNNLNNAAGENQTNQTIENNTSTTEKVNVWLAILSYFVPIAGLIIFIVKKQDEPKTAKVSGICALVSFIINLIIAGIVVAISVISVNGAVDKVKDIGSKLIDKQKEIVDNNIKKGTASSNWKDYEVKINDYVIELPCSFNQLSTSTGFNMKSAQEDSSISANHYVTVNLYRNDNLALYIEILNDTDADIKIPDGKVTRIWQSKYQVSKGADEIIFPGDLKAGIKITEQELTDKFGEPFKKDNYSINGYEKITYHYVQNTEWTTSNFLEVSVVNGVIDEIILDHRDY